MFSNNLLLVYIGVLVVLFIIAVVIIAIATTRAARSGTRNNEIDGPTNAAPIPTNDERRNPSTRVDSPNQSNEVEQDDFTGAGRRTADNERDNR